MASKDADETLNNCCPVCLLDFVYPSELPCGHTFCFLCIKGLFLSDLTTSTCPLCRHQIPKDWLDKPHLRAARAAEKREATNGEKSAQDDNQDSEATKTTMHKWFYEGNNGWWQYDERTSNDLENEFQKNPKSKYELLIAGNIYVIDFDALVQYRRDGLARKRRIKRDMDDKNLKGVAGIKIDLLNVVKPSTTTTATTTPKARRSRKKKQSVDVIPVAADSDSDQTTGGKLNFFDSKSVFFVLFLKSFFFLFSREKKVETKKKNQIKMSATNRSI